jgi:hypothetical protein
VLALQGELAQAMDTSTAVSRTITLRDASKFPPRGIVTIDSEVISYNRLVGNQLQDLTRGLRGSLVAVHAAGAAVILDAPVTPPSALVSGATDINTDPDPVFTGAGRDGVLQVYFIETQDPETGLPLTDPVTGAKISVWTLDTDTSSVTDPQGSVVLIAAAARTDPGLFSLSRLRIEPNVILRAIGTRPLRILVSEVAEIAGTLDVSGFDGGLLEFDVNHPATPTAGSGGAAGPGGGAGGAGGSMVFLDGNIDNKDPANTNPIPARWGGLPAGFPPELDRTGPTSGNTPPPILAPMETTRATAGEALRDTANCGGTVTAPCTAGGGGGGGARVAGLNGEARPTSSTAFGRGGSAIGGDSFRYGGGVFPAGGQGGAGGGSSTVVSDDYKNGRAGPAVFQGDAKYGPGTGGGGGGGLLHLMVQGALNLRSTGAILARGGDGFQSIDLAGNGGAGGGGAVLIQLGNSLSIEPGARIDVSGGLANQALPNAPGVDRPFYEGNVRKVVTGEVRSFGGNGGNGAVGRVRFEAPANSNLLKSGFNDSISSAILLLDTFVSTGTSLALPLGVGPGSRASSHLFLLDSPILLFAPQGLPEGTNAILTWQGGEQSLDVHGQPGPLVGGVENVDDLQTTEYIRFSVIFLSNVLSGEAPVVKQVTLPYKLGNAKNR